MSNSKKRKENYINIGVKRTTKEVIKSIGEDGWDYEKCIQRLLIHYYENARTDISRKMVGAGYVIPKTEEEFINIYGPLGDNKVVQIPPKSEAEIQQELERFGLKKQKTRYEVMDTIVRAANIGHEKSVERDTTRKQILKDIQKDLETAHIIIGNTIDAKCAINPEDYVKYKKGLAK